MNNKKTLSYCWQTARRSNISSM